MRKGYTKLKFNTLGEKEAYMKMLQKANQWYSIDKDELVLIVKG